MAKRKRRTPSTMFEVAASHPPVSRGLVSHRRMVPRHIDRPAYVATGDPGPSVSSLVRTDAELDAMRRTGAIAAETLIRAGELVRPGVTTDQIDQLVHEATIARGGYPSPLGYRGFPKSVCTSVNEVICHGIPDSRPLADGDIINIDVTVWKEGVHGDTSATFLVGDVDEHSLRLVEETLAALHAGMAAVRPGTAVNAIGRAIEAHANQHGLGVVREFIGHGVGTEFHSSLQIPHFYDRRANTILSEKVTFTIEPMLTLGSPDIAMWDDDWTAVTLDGRRTAQFEHTLVVAADGVEVLTQTPGGDTAHEMFARRSAEIS
jgi:methionyl aminopeptidase